LGTEAKGLGKRGKPRASSKFLIDHPHYCPSCGAQYYVSGGPVETGSGKRKRIYEVSGESENEIYTYPDYPLCPSCLDELVSLSYLEEVFGEEIRSF
jgi:hypothetical protein